MADPDPTPVATSCKEARTLGLTIYFTGKPCPQGHIGARSIYTQGCVVCIRARSAQWEKSRSDTPQRAAARLAGIAHYDPGKPCQNGHAPKRWVRDGRCVECEVARGKKWRKARPGTEAEWARKRRAADPAAHRAEVKRWAQKNPEVHKGTRARWVARNPELQRMRSIAYAANYRTRKKQNGGAFTSEDIAALYHQQRGLCAACSAPLTRFHVDHVLSVSRGGSSDRSNLQLLCPKCNRSKGSKLFEEWMEECGFVIKQPPLQL